MLYDARGNPLLSSKEKAADKAKLDYVEKTLGPHAVAIVDKLVDLKLSPPDALQVVGIVLSWVSQQTYPNDRVKLRARLNDMVAGIMAMTDPDPAFRGFYDANYKDMEAPDGIELKK